ncbi:MAG TPA: ATP-binding protein, partial [Pseudonocardiaceae bacterium]|nr:ATP-binding protein [Pseudonocardiaceae bacterium]
LVVVIARQLVRSIGVLRRTARDVAARQLPDAVERIRAGETVDATVAPVGVHTSDEVGQLARAFDAVHGEALRLAVEQANLRANYSELFVNLSRRSQSLVQRQLRLIEQLERDEEDPEQLSALFKLDHLATRMRRNNENLMVLSGSELARSTSQQVALADLLRAAVSEIEHYQRVVVQPPPDTHIVGYAASDLVRLLAELLDNATAFSSPETPVTVASHRTRRRAIVIDIVDHGIGMSDEELAAANEQLSHPAGVEGRISRRMGLYVISRLANQHDVRVRLHGGQDIPGLRVTITVPAELVIGEPEPLPPGLPPRGGDGGNGDGGSNGNGGGNGGGGSLGGPLPKRTAGASNGAWQGALRGTLGTATPAGPVVDPVDAAMTVTIPKLPSAVSSGVGLFEPITDGEPAVEIPDGGGEAAVADRTEITPIYDTMASAWFEEAGSASPPEPEPAARTSWTFAADEGWQAVDAVVAVQPEEFTAAGLPKRQPKAMLLPGSVRHEQQDRAAGPSADRVRHRLSGFQQGLHRGRSQAGKPETQEPQALQPPEEAPEAPAPPATDADPVAVTETLSAEGWTSSADDGWRAVDEVAGAQPGELTAAGLPKRRPKAHLLPGSVAANGRNGVHVRDAGATRDRLSSFQRGVSRGRGGSQPADQDRVEHGFHW